MSEETAQGELPLNLARHIDDAPPLTDEELKAIRNPETFIAVLRTPKVIVGLILKSIKRLQQEIDKSRGLEIEIEAISRKAAKEESHDDILNRMMNTPSGRAAILAYSGKAEKIDYVEKMNDLEMVEQYKRNLLSSLSKYDSTAKTYVSLHSATPNLVGSGLNPPDTERLRQAINGEAEVRPLIETKPARKGTPGQRGATAAQIASAIEQARNMVESGTVKVKAS